MQEKLKSSIYNLHDWIDVSKAIADSLVLSEFNIEELDELVWSYQLAHRWVQLRVEDELNGMMEWAKPTFEADALLQSTIVAFIRQHGDETIVDKFYEQLQTVDRHIVNLIEYHVSDSPWHVWHTKFVSDYMLLECDEDYRIKVYNEKVASGAWRV